MSRLSKLFILAFLFGALQVNAQKPVMIYIKAKPTKKSWADIYSSLTKKIADLNKENKSTVYYITDQEITISNRIKYCFYGELTFREVPNGSNPLLEVKIHFTNPSPKPEENFKEFDISGLWAETNTDGWTRWIEGAAEDIKQLYNTQKRMSTMYVKVLSPPKISNGIKISNNPKNIRVYYYSYDRVADYCESDDQQFDILWCEARNKTGSIQHSLHRNQLEECAKVNGDNLEKVMENIRVECERLLQKEYNRIYKPKTLLNSTPVRATSTAILLNNE